MERYLVLACIVASFILPGCLAAEVFHETFDSYAGVIGRGGSFSGGYSFVPGFAGNAANLSDYVYYDRPASFSQGTIEFFFEPSETYWNSNNAGLFDLFLPATDDLILYWTKYTAYGKTTILALKDHSGIESQDWTPMGDMTPGWHHFAAVWKCGASGSYLEAFLDGETTGKYDYPSGVCNFQPAAGGDMRIGKTWCGTSHALLDEFHIYDDLKTQAQILQENSPAIISYLPNADTVMTTVGGSIDFSVTASDPHNAALTYKWLVNGVQAGTGASYHYTAADSSEDTVTVNVSNGVFSAQRSWAVLLGNSGVAIVGGKIYVNNSLFLVKGVDYNPALGTESRIPGETEDVTSSVKLGTIQYVKDYNSDGKVTMAEVARHDFEIIESAGANTIRTYASGVWHDKDLDNVNDSNEMNYADIPDWMYDDMLDFAEPKGMKVLVGYWVADENGNGVCDATDLAIANKTLRRIVQKYGSRSGVLGWAIGNEVIGNTWSPPCPAWSGIDAYTYMNKLYAEVKELSDKPIMYAKYFNEPVDFGNLNADILGPQAYIRSAAEMETQFSTPPAGHAYLMAEFGHLIEQAQGHWDLAKQHAGGCFLEYNDVGWKGDGQDVLGMVEEYRAIRHERFNVVAELYDAFADGCGSSTSSDFCQNCYDNNGRVKSYEAGCFCDNMGIYVNAWFGSCPETACYSGTPCDYSWQWYGEDKYCRNMDGAGWAWTYCTKCNGLGCAGDAYPVSYPIGATAACDAATYTCTASGWEAGASKSAELAPEAGATATGNDKGFVYANGTDFYLNGKPYYFSGTNNYYLRYGDADCAGYDIDRGCTREVLNDAYHMGLQVIRTWGFADGYYYWGPLQYDRGLYNETSLRQLDYMVKEAYERDIKLVIPLVNNWIEYGGMCKYVEWCGIPGYCNPQDDNSGTHDQFYTNACARQAYKDFVSMLLNRVNTYTGVAYKDDPTIFAWELANEPVANSDTTGDALDAWVGEMSNHIESIDKNHMVTTGMEGFYLNKPESPVYDADHDWMYDGTKGTDFVRNHDHANIDYATFHLYPMYWNLTLETSLLWLGEHVEDSKTLLGKPVVMGEFGMVPPDKDEFLAAWYDEAWGLKTNGNMFWMLADLTYRNRWEQDLGTSYPGDESTVAIIINATERVKEYNKQLSPLNRAPQVANIAPITVNEGDTVTLTVSATDADGDFMFYSISDAYHFDKTARNVFKWKTGPLDSGEYWILVTATDGISPTGRMVQVTVLDTQVCVTPYDGLVIDRDATLCPGVHSVPKGIKVGNVTLDCNGATLAGSGGDTKGISATGRDIMIKNCKIQGYRIGIQLEHADGPVVQGNTMTSSMYQGINMQDTTDAQITGNTFSYIYDIGVYGYQSSWNVIQGNTFQSDGKAVYFDTCADNVVRGNRLLDTKGAGVYMTYSARNIVDSNEMARGGIQWHSPEDAAVYAGSSTANDIRDNWIYNGYKGIYLYGSTNSHVHGNTVSGNSPSGVTIAGGSGNFIYHNNIIGNTLQASDNSANTWELSLEGNYWSDFDQSSEGCTDGNGDFICDASRGISGGISRDYHAFTKQDGWLRCFSDADCDYLDDDYCSGDSIMRDEGKCVAGACQAQASAVRDCNDNNSEYCFDTEIRSSDYTCHGAECVLDSVVRVTECDDGLWCTGQEACMNAACVPGTALDCSRNSLPRVTSCDNVPDGNPDTWDYSPSFTSTCSEALQACTTSARVFTHTCSVLCGAECESDGDCDDGNALTADTCSASCTCSNQMPPPVCDEAAPCGLTFNDAGTVKYCRDMDDGQGYRWLSPAEAAPFCNDAGDRGNLAYCNGLEIVCADDTQWKTCAPETACATSYKVGGIAHYCRDFGDGYKWYTAAEGAPYCNGADDKGNRAYCGNSEVVCADDLKWKTCSASTTCGTSQIVESAIVYCRDMDDGLGYRWLTVAEAAPYCNGGEDIGNLAYCGGQEIICADDIKWKTCGPTTTCATSYTVQGVPRYCRNPNNEGWEWMPCAKCNGIGCASSPLYGEYTTGDSLACYYTSKVCTATGWADGVAKSADPTLPLPNLEVAGVSYSPDPIVKGADFSYDITVQNTGTMPVSTSLGFYINGNYMGSIPAPNLAAGASHVTGVSRFGFVGVFNFTFVVDPAGDIAEAEEDDNTYSGMVTVVPDPDDSDGDGYTAASSGGDDCDDTDKDVNPREEEVCYDIIDNDCNAETDDNCTAAFGPLPAIHVSYPLLAPQPACDASVLCNATLDDNGAVEYCRDLLFGYQWYSEAEMAPYCDSETDVGYPYYCNGTVYKCALAEGTDGGPWTLDWSYVGHEECVTDTERPCDTGLPGVCAPGVQTCLERRWAGCGGFVEAGEEACGDALDNDCDGETDEGC